MTMPRFKIRDLLGAVALVVATYSVLVISWGVQ